MSVEIKWAVEDDTQTFDLRGGRDCGAINGERKTVNFGEGGFGANKKY